MKNLNVTSSMKCPPYVEKYLKRHGDTRWTLSSLPHEPVESVIVIPALAERDNLFQTILSLVRNEAFDLASVLLLCVINNKPAGIAPRQDIENNMETMCFLNYLSRFANNTNIPDAILTSGEVEEIRKSNLNITYVDASSAGKELPPKGGVGLARKIGMDLALTTLDYEKQGPSLIVCLDADTLTDENYLLEISRYFRETKREVALLSFSHVLPQERRRLSAIACYEIFLRYYRLGLKYAGTPYAFHTIGSTMVCTAKSYTAIGGMNTKEAGEDFYFLQKLAKYSAIGEIKNTTVYPSARVSDRVPFGTGRKMKELDASGEAFFPFYDPRSFQILRDFVATIKGAVNEGVSEGEPILDKCRVIEPLLADFLEARNFASVWGKIEKNSPNKEKLLRSFHEWFDAFTILKLIHYLRDNGFIERGMFQAVSGLMARMNLKFPFNEADGENCEKAVELLQYMRSLEKSL